MIDVFRKADSQPRAPLLGLLALERGFDGDYPGRRTVADDALTMARRLGDPATILDVLLRRHDAIRLPDTSPIVWPTRPRPKR